MPLQVRRLLTAVLLVVLLAASGAAAQEQMGAQGGTGATIASPQALPQALTQGAAALNKQIETLQTQLRNRSGQLAGAQEDLQKLQIAVASIKAALALKQAPLPQVFSFLVTYGAQEGALKDRSGELAKDAAALQKTLAEEVLAENELRSQMEYLKGKEPGFPDQETEGAFFSYLQLADTRDRLTAQLVQNLGDQRQNLEEQRQLLAGLLPQLKKVQETWQAELLQRQAQQAPVKEQVARVWHDLAALPGRARDWLTDLWTSGELGTIFRHHLGQLLGLLSFILLVGWSTRRLSRNAKSRFRRWREAAADLHLLPLFFLGSILISNLFLLGLIFWVGLFFWSFRLLGSEAAQLGLYGLAALWALRLGLQAVDAYIGGHPPEVALDLKPAAARFYRRSLKAFLVYLFLGFVGLRGAGLLGFPADSLHFLRHCFQVGMLFWALWLGRRAYLERLRPALPDPAWLRRPYLLRGLVDLVRFLVAVIILADLLGFTLLASYLARGATWTGLAVMLLWLLWLVAATILHHSLHPEVGWARRRYPEAQVMVQRLYVTGRWVLSLLLGAAVLIWSLSFWGVKPGSVAWALRWLTWGPSLGSLKLTTLNLGGAVLTIFVGIQLSRVIRGVMAVRIFPHTGLDPGVQYTVTATLHYVVLIVAAMLALNILGFPLTNLALVAGALGLGIGFGLQNIVSNFISGLILLFERPIKVGDMLVIDGQWGTVREIRVRSTIFETFDRYVLIIPNSELVSNRVLNWTHYGRGVNRLNLKVGVSYEAEVREVTRLLTEVCRANPRVVAEPPPQITFNAYGDSSLEFNIWVFVKTPADRVPATHELNSAIFETFREHGIDIPFPQRDLHIKEWPAPPEKPGTG
jgi:potassium efflux system protein